MRENPGNPEYDELGDSIDDLQTQVFASNRDFQGVDSRVPKYNPYTNMYESVKTSSEKEAEQMKKLMQSSSH